MGYYEPRSRVGLRTRITCNGVTVWISSATRDLLLIQQNMFDLCSGVPRGGGVRGVQTPPLNLQKKFVLCVCKIYYPSPALMFIKSKILYRKTLEIVR